MPAIITRGAASAKGFGFTGGGAPAVYIEDVFSTYLYTGTGATQTITNSIDSSTKGGLVWIKSRSGATGHRLTDTARGVTKSLASETTAAQATESTGLTAFGTTGFTIGADADYNTSADTYASWTFRKQPKFFDVVTYTGDGTSSQTINHNLGASPGCIITKRTDSTGNWTTWHRSFADTKTYIYLNTTAASVNVPSADAMTVSSTSFTVGTNQVFGNGSGFVYVAYIFAHNAGGFGLTGTDNVISCGSFTTDGSGNATVSLGYEPQWLMIKRTDAPGNWIIVDTMRGFSAPPSTTSEYLYPNDSAAAGSLGFNLNATSTGFYENGGLGLAVPCIYIAIRRGPMKVPTDGTSVFAIDTRHNTAPAFVSNFPVDMSTYRAKSGSDWYLSSRLTPNYLLTDSTAAENASPLFSTTQFAYNTGWGDSGASIPDLFSYMFKRAPSFFDVVCYTGTGANTTQTHNLGAVPELIIVKGRSGATAWQIYASGLANTEYLVLNTTAAKATGATRWNSTTPTSTVFSLGTASEVNTSAATYVAYLFATCAGVSKVGSYTGNGSTQTIDCGLTAGARFVLIKRTDAVGDWYVYDTARGMTTLTDPYLLLNTTAAEVATLGSVTTVATGFALNSAILAAINVSAGTYIFLAIA